LVPEKHLKEIGNVLIAVQKLPNFRLNLAKTDPSTAKIVGKKEEKKNLVDNFYLNV
jgi:hypothetical protein